MLRTHVKVNQSYKSENSELSFGFSSLFKRQRSSTTLNCLLFLASHSGLGFSGSCHHPALSPENPDFPGLYSPQCCEILLHQGPRAAIGLCWMQCCLRSDSYWKRGYSEGSWGIVSYSCRGQGQEKNKGGY